MCNLLYQEMYNLLYEETYLYQPEQPPFEHATRRWVIYYTNILCCVTKNVSYGLVNNPPTSPLLSVRFGQPKPINWVIGFGWQTEVGPYYTYTLVTREAFTLATQR